MNETPAKDFWDKFNIVSNISVAVAIALIGSLFAWHSDMLKTDSEIRSSQKKHQIDQLNVLYKYFPHLSEGTEEEKRVSLIMINVLNPELSKKLIASMPSSPGIDGALQSIADSSPNDKEIQRLWNAIQERESLRLSVSEVPKSGIDGQKLAALSCAVRELNKDVREIPDGSNRSPDIDKYWGNTGVIGAPWSMAFISFCLSQAENLEYPTHHLGVQTFMRYARREEWVVDSPQPGDIFIQIKSGGRGNAGFVQRVENDSIFTIEGNVGNRIKAGKRPISSINYFVRPPVGKVPG